MSTTVWKKIRRKLKPKGKNCELTNSTDCENSPPSTGTIERYERMCQQHEDHESSPEPVSPAKSQNSDVIDIDKEPVAPIRYSSCSGDSGDSECTLRIEAPPIKSEEKKEEVTEQKPVKKVAPPLLVPLRNKRPKSQGDEPNQNTPLKGAEDKSELEEIRTPPVCPPRPARDPRITSRPLPPEIREDDDDKQTPPSPPKKTRPYSQQIQVRVQVESHPEPKPATVEVPQSPKPAVNFSRWSDHTHPDPQKSGFSTTNRLHRLPNGPKREAVSATKEPRTKPEQTAEPVPRRRSNPPAPPPRSDNPKPLPAPLTIPTQPASLLCPDTAQFSPVPPPPTFMDEVEDFLPLPPPPEELVHNAQATRENDAQTKQVHIAQVHSAQAKEVDSALAKKVHSARDLHLHVEASLSSTGVMGTDSGYSTLDEVVAQWESQKRHAKEQKEKEVQDSSGDSANKGAEQIQNRNHKGTDKAVEVKTELANLTLVENKTYDTFEPAQKRLSNALDENKNVEEEGTTAVPTGVDKAALRSLAKDLTLLLDNRQTAPVAMPIHAEQNGNVDANVNVLTTAMTSRTETESAKTDKAPDNAKKRPAKPLYTLVPRAEPKSRESIKNSLDSDEDDLEGVKLDEAVGPASLDADEENNELDSGTEMGIEYYEQEEVFHEPTRREEEDGYLPPVPTRNYEECGQLKVEPVEKKTLKVHITQLETKNETAMSSDSGTEESSPSALSLSGSESKDVEPTHMSWDEVMLEAQNLGIPLVKPAVQETPKSPAYSGRSNANMMSSSMISNTSMMSSSMISNSGMMSSSMTSSMMSCDTVLSIDSGRSLSSSSDYHLRLYSPSSDYTKPPSPGSSSDRSSDYLDCNRYARSLPSPGPTGDLLPPKEKRKIPLKEKFKLQNFFHKKSKDKLDAKGEKQKAATLHIEVQRRRLPMTPMDQEDVRSICSSGYGRSTGTPSPSPSLMRQLSNSSAHSLHSPSPHLSPQPQSPQLNGTPLCSPHVSGLTYPTTGPVPAPLPIVAPPIYTHGRDPSSPRAGCSKSADFIGSLKKLKDCGWYWGPLNWDDAEIKLANKPDGSFLVRDSSDDRYILSLSFRSQQMTHHTRIEHYKGMFSFYSQPKSHGASTIVEFIEKAMEHSQSGKFLYFLRPRAPGLPPAPVQLLYPVSRFRNMHSLQHVCRFVILKSVRKDHIDRLPIPPKIKLYLQQSQYYTEYYSHEEC